MRLPEWRLGEQMFEFPASRIHGWREPTDLFGLRVRLPLWPIPFVCMQTKCGGVVGTSRTSRGGAFLVFEA